VNMNSTIEKPRLALPLRRYSADQTRHHVDFFCDAPQAKGVALVGDFNGWDTTATPMHRTTDGRWTVTLELHHGHHQYLFVVDGTPRLDTKAGGTARNNRNEPVSIVAVS